jgi:hypothetical protein
MRQTGAMHGAFATVLWVVCGLGVAGALVALASSGRAWRALGRGGLSLEREPPPERAALACDAQAERRAEIEALVRARNERRVRRGQEPIDVDEEVGRLLGDHAGAGIDEGPADLDPELRAEIRALLEARNERRRRRGEDPIDLDSEVQRQIADLRSRGRGEPSGADGFPLG